jgi:hypothetical protein
VNCAAKNGVGSDLYRRWIVLAVNYDAVNCVRWIVRGELCAVNCARWIVHGIYLKKNQLETWKKKKKRKFTFYLGLESETSEVLAQAITLYATEVDNYTDFIFLSFLEFFRIL